jgi:transposase InsO family protein
MVERVLAGWSTREAARSAGVSAQTCRKWVARYRREGAAGLQDRLSVAHRIPARTRPERVEAICALRRLRFTGAQIAEILAMPPPTVSAVLLRAGMGRLGRLGLAPARRYERQRPGELVHIDVKKLGRITRGAGHRVTGRQHYSGSRTDRAGVRRQIAGWECVHVAIDDASRLAYAEVLEDETAASAVGFLHRALAFYERHGIQVEAVMTDNGSPYVSVAHALACRQLGLRHLRTRPRRPQTNGKAERFIRTMLSEMLLWRVKRRAGVPLQEPEELPGDGALEAALNLAQAAAFGGPARRVAAGRAVVAQANEDDVVKGPVELAVALAREPVTAHLPGGRRQRRHPRQGGKGRLAADPAGVRPAHQQLR